MRVESAHRVSSRKLLMLGNVGRPVQIARNTALHLRFQGVIAPFSSAMVHLWGWGAQFPTPLDKRLWHVATVGLISTSALFTTSRFDLHRVREKLNKRMEGFLLMQVFDSMVFIIFGTAACLHYFSIAVLLIESIHQIFYLPPKVYAVASLSHYFPPFFLMYVDGGQCICSNRCTCAYSLYRKIFP